MIKSGNGDSLRLEPHLPFADQRGGLKMMGVLLIAVGLLGGCVGITSQAAMLSPQAAAAAGIAAVSPRRVAVALFVMALGAGLLITLGTASVRLRRWAAPLIVGLSATWALVGAAKVALAIVFGPTIQRALANSVPATAPSTAAVQPAQPPPGFLVAAIVLFMITVLLPTGFLYFYSRESARQTLAHVDPRPAWTDRVPLAVIALAFWLMLGALASLAAAGSGTFPAIGVLLEGRAAAAAWGTVALLFAALAWGVLRLKPAAWWLALGAAAASVVGVILTTSRVDFAEFSRNSASPTARIDATQRVAQQLLYAAVAIVYVLSVRKYFRQGNSEAPLTVKSKVD